MRSFRLGNLRPDGTVEPASPLAAEILAAVVAGDDDRQRELLTLAARLDDDDAHTTTKGPGARRGVNSIPA